MILQYSYIFIIAIIIIINISIKVKATGLKLIDIYTVRQEFIIQHLFSPFLYFFFISVSTHHVDLSSHYIKGMFVVFLVYTLSSHWLSFPLLNHRGQRGVSVMPWKREWRTLGCTQLPPAHSMQRNTVDPPWRQGSAWVVHLKSKPIVCSLEITSEGVVRDERLASRSVLQLEARAEPATGHRLWHYMDAEPHRSCL